MTDFIFKDVWAQLGKASKTARGPAYVAVAYFGKNASKLLKLNAGSRLVVNASEACVKAGQTYPRGLKRLLPKGVRVYTVGNLHAKVFVFGSRAFVGSANVSRLSANTLIEAVIATKERGAVKASRQFVRDLCREELGPKELDRLSKLYRSPRFGAKPPGLKRHPRNGVKPLLGRIRLAQLVLEDPPPGSEKTEAAGRRAARSRMDEPKKQVLEHFCWTGKCAFKVGESVSEITEEWDGRLLASVPGHVVHRVSWQSGKIKCAFVYVEREPRRRILVERLAKKIGSGALKRLRRGGLTSSDFSERLWAAWARPR